MLTTQLSSRTQEFKHMIQINIRVVTLLSATYTTHTIQHVTHTIMMNDAHKKMTLHVI